MVFAQVLVHYVVLYLVYQLHVEQIGSIVEQVTNDPQMTHLLYLVEFREHEVVDMIRRQFRQLKRPIHNFAIGYEL